MNRGSVWRKWDLHVHTPASFTHSFKFVDQTEKSIYHNNIWHKYIDQLETISNVSVLGITDYFTVEGYQKVVDYKQQGRLTNFDLILPNIEFRIDKFVSDRRLNYHVIFSDQIHPQVIEKEFLEELHIKTPTGEQRKLTKTNIEQIGQLLKEHHPTFKGKSDYLIGCENITVSLDEIIGILNKKTSLFAGKYLLVLPEEGWCLIDWAGQDHLTRKELLVRSHAIFSSNKNTREWALGQKHAHPDDFLKEFGALRPCIHGSDAHSFEKLCNPDEKRYCWIKADTSFDGLKQVIYEPDERLTIQPEDPEIRKSVYTLNSMKISEGTISDDLSLEDRTLLLNANLVVVTGGKGSGKTALLDLIANCFEDRCKRAGEDRNSFVQRIERQKPQLRVEVTFVGKDVEPFSKDLADENYFRHSRITYLPQGRIEEYSADRGTLNTKIEEIMLRNRDVIDSGYEDVFNQLRKDIAHLVGRIDQINWEISELEKATTREILSGLLHQKAIKEGELKNHEHERTAQEDVMEEQITQRAATLAEEAQQLGYDFSDLSSLESDLEFLLIKLQDNVLDHYSPIISEMNATLSRVGLDITIPDIDLTSLIDSVTQARQLIASHRPIIYEQLETKRAELKQLSGAEKKHAEVLESIEVTKEQIKECELKIIELHKKRDRIEFLDRERLESYLKIVRKYWDWKKYYETVIRIFSRGKSVILRGIEFQADIYFDKQAFIELGADILDLRRINIDEIEKCALGLELIATKENDPMVEGKLATVMMDLFKKKELLKTTRSSYDFDEWAFRNYCGISSKILFGERGMDKLSIGQKGTVLLKLYLAEGDYPLIVDQPEENLDNKFIYDELVGALREAKRKRQIIIATNNANLVVNADAEQIIVAEYENNRIGYRSGSLENMEIREEIVPILEGGKEAFRKREEKYGISDLGR